MKYLTLVISIIFYSCKIGTMESIYDIEDHKNYQFYFHPPNNIFKLTQDYNETTLYIYDMAKNNVRKARISFPYHFLIDWVDYKNVVHIHFNCLSKQQEEMSKNFDWNKFIEFSAPNEYTFESKVLRFNGTSKSRKQKTDSFSINHLGDRIILFHQKNVIDSVNTNSIFIDTEGDLNSFSYQENIINTKTFEIKNIVILLKELESTIMK